MAKARVEIQTRPQSRAIEIARDDPRAANLRAIIEAADSNPESVGYYTITHSKESFIIAKRGGSVVAIDGGGRVVVGLGGDGWAKRVDEYCEANGVKHR